MESPSSSVVIEGVRGPSGPRLFTGGPASASAPSDGGDAPSVQGAACPCPARDAGPAVPAHRPISPFATGAPGPSDPGAPFVSLRVRPGVETLVDVDVAQRIAGARLRLMTGGYVGVRLGRPARPDLLHRLVCPGAPGEDVHHRNRDRLDNRRANLVCLPRWAHRLSHRMSQSKQDLPGVLLRGSRFGVAFLLAGHRLYAPTFRSRILACLAGDSLLRSVGAPEEALCFARQVGRDGLRELVESAGHGFFRVWFVRRGDGRLRDMLCRTGVKKDQVGRGPTFDPQERGLVSVFDVRARAYRFIPLEGVLALRVAGRSYRVRHSADEKG